MGLLAVAVVLEFPNAIPDQCIFYHESEVFWSPSVSNSANVPQGISTTHQIINALFTGRDAHWPDRFAENDAAGN